MNERANLLDRANLWVLLPSLFLYIGLLPNVLYSRYLTEGVVHKFTYGTVAVCVALLWIYWKFDDRPTRVLTLIYGIRPRAVGMVRDAGHRLAATLHPAGRLVHAALLGGGRRHHAADSRR